VTLAAAMLLAACTTTRSISNSRSHYDTTQSRCFIPRPPADPGFEYRGELNEFDVLGIERARLTTEEEIQSALHGAKSMQLAPGSSILLVQSGAVFPDGSMMHDLKSRFHVTPFSGIPPHRRTMSNPEPPEEFSYSKSLRLAAARAGAETVVCYWGILESARRDLETKAASWVPIAGWLLPDERQHMRIRLKVAVIDVRTGNWTLFCPEPFTDAAASTRFTRSSSDQNQIERLKEKAYKAAAEELLAMASRR